MPPSFEQLAERVAKPWPQLEVRSEEDLKARIEELREGLSAALAGIRDEKSLRQQRDLWLARKTGLLALANDNWLKAAPPEWKRNVGAGLNQLKQEAESGLSARQAELSTGAARDKVARERVDVTLPGKPSQAGGLHPILQVLEEVTGIFVRLGYSVADGPEIETPYYNFEALNIPEGHPARDDQDTLYLAPGEVLLRSHTSPVQVRTMEAQKPPLRIVAPGRVYRRDAPDASHSPMFHQLEGLAVDTHLTLRDLKGTLDHFAREMFGSTAVTRFRPSYFQFTEPSAEMDVSCIFCGGKGCRTCKQSGWIEILGCGMVNPAVFPFVKYDPELYSGFAWGMGIDRIAMIRYDVDDLQRFFNGDIRFLEQFRS